MDNDQISEWMAFDLASNHDWREKYFKEVDLELQKTQSLEEEATKIKMMFMKLGNK